MTSKRNFIIILAMVIAIMIFFFVGRSIINAPQNINESPASQTGPTATINNQTFLLEIVNDDKGRQLGLSNRQSLPQDHGMLFLFERSDNYSFWMKDMHFPIDIIYINNDTVVHVFENVPPPKSKRNLPVYTPDSPSDKVLEINAGLSKKFDITKGTKVKIKY